MQVEPGSPFRIAVLADLSGRENRGVREVGSQLANRPILRIDRDNFDSVMRRLNVRLSPLKVSPECDAVAIQFQKLSDFHPDELYQELGLFSSLRNLRERLLDRKTYKSAADEILAWGQPQARASAEPDLPAKKPLPQPMSPGSLLDQILDPNAPSVDSSAGQVRGEWQRFIEEIVAPYSSPGANPRQAEMLACIDGAAQASMRNLLHQTGFRDLESIWRGIHFLVRRVESDAQLKIYVIDISKDELAEDLLKVDDIKSTAIYRLLVEQSVGTPGGEAWSFWAGNYTFGLDDKDAKLLGRIAEIAAAAGAPFMAAASSELAGQTDVATNDKLNLDNFANSQAWKAVRLLPGSDFVGLVWPRFLLRLPYGAKLNPIEQFVFEEMPEPGSRAQLLWGNPSLLCAVLLGESFSQNGWSLRPGELNRIDNLPVWVNDRDDEAKLQPCGEFLLTDQVISDLRSQGIIPVISIRDHDFVRIGEFCSLTGNALSGPWFR